MADFKKAFAITSPWEGGYVNDPVDAGGETYRGISRKNWPNWPGWKIVDRHKPLKRHALIDDPELDAMVEDFFLVNFWHKIKGDQVNNQAIANVLFDWRVTSGYHAPKALQKVVGEVPDGLVGPKTLLSVNAGCQKDIFTKFIALREKFYRDIVVNRPTQRKYLNGWLRRARSFKFEL